MDAQRQCSLQNNMWKYAKDPTAKAKERGWKKREKSRLKVHFICSLFS